MEPAQVAIEDGWVNPSGRDPACEKVFTLDKLSLKRVACVVSLNGNGVVCRRLAELGLVPGVEVRVVGRAPFRGPIKIFFRNNEFSLRADQARCVQVAERAPTCVVMTDLCTGNCGSCCSAVPILDKKNEDPLAAKGIAAVQAPPFVAVRATPATTLDRDHPRIALIGNPNVGKSTLWNRLTGMNQKTGNYPGSTVDFKTAPLKLPSGAHAQLIDLPGLYSLTPCSLDERVALETLCGQQPEVSVPDRVVAVVDAANIARNLQLITEVLEMGLPLVLVLTMLDVAEERGMCIDAVALEAALGIRVIPVVASEGTGITELLEAMDSPRAAVAPLPWAASEMESEDAAAAELEEQVTRNTTGITSGQARAMAKALALSSEYAKSNFSRAKRRKKGGDGPASLEDVYMRYRWIDAMLSRTATDVERRKALLRDRIDKVLLHPFFGLLIFAVVMVAFFCVIFYVGDALKGVLEDIVTVVGNAIAPVFPKGLLRDLWTDGIIAGIIPVLTFLPQVVLIFVLLTVLEGSGYLARGAFLLDRLLCTVGLHGRSFVPLVTSYACAVPGIMAARTLPDVRERLATMFVAPFMACPARLPVYTLMISACFSGMNGWKKGMIMTGLYFGGIVAAIVVSFVLRHTVIKGKGASFLIELPTYQRPDGHEIARAAVQATKMFLRRVGTVILVFSIILWACMTFPQLDESEFSDATNSSDHDLAFKQAQLEQSIAGTIGHIIEPVIRPAGMDWRIGIGLLSAFAAREAFTSTLGMVYGVDSEDSTRFEDRLRSVTRDDGSPMWTPLLATVVLIWFMLAMQCFSTIVVMYKESRSWRWALGQVVLMNVMAWVICVIIWQVGCAAGAAH
eukprot:m51a1_g6632 hypothetical protein (852) ;mRNA; r:73357-75912